MSERLLLTLALLAFLAVYVYAMSRRWYWLPYRDPVVYACIALVAALWGVEVEAP